jgi:hypothetical protein
MRKGRWMVGGLGAGAWKTWMLLCAFVVLLPVSSMAWEPNQKDLGEAIRTADFANYSTKLRNWLTEKTPRDPESISMHSLKALLDDRFFALALAQFHFVNRVGGASLKAAAKDSSNEEFLTWILSNTEVMVHCMEGITPAVVSKRRQANAQLPAAALSNWKTIYDADPDSTEGVCLKLAIATAIYPPGTSHHADGQAWLPATPVERYMQFKVADENDEMAQGFDALSVWEYGKSVSCNASDEEMIWARKMINTWRPDLRVNEHVVMTTSEVWRRYSPFPYNNSYKNVLSGHASETRVFLNCVLRAPSWFRAS